MNKQNNKDITFDLKFLEEAKIQVKKIIENNACYANRIEGAIIIPLYSDEIDMKACADGVVALRENTEYGPERVMKTVERVNSFAATFSNQYTRSVVASLGRATAQLTENQKGEEEKKDQHGKT